MKAATYLLNILQNHVQPLQEYFKKNQPVLNERFRTGLSDVASGSPLRWTVAHQRQESAWKAVHTKYQSQLQLSAKVRAANGRLMKSDMKIRENLKAKDKKGSDSSVSISE